MLSSALLSASSLVLRMAVCGLAFGVRFAIAAEPYEPFLSGLGKEVCGEKDTLGRSRSDAKIAEGLRGEVP